MSFYTVQCLLERDAVDKGQLTLTETRTGLPETHLGRVGGENVLFTLLHKAPHIEFVGRQSLPKDDNQYGVLTLLSSFSPYQYRMVMIMMINKIEYIMSWLVLEDLRAFTYTPERQICIITTSSQEKNSASL